MKLLKWLKFSLFILSGIGVIIFAEFFLEEIKNLHYLIGAIMLFYSLEATIRMLIHNEFKEEKMLFINQIITFILGVIVIVLPETENSIVVMSIFWSVWAIMRESEEIYEKVFKNMDCKIVGALNFAESIVVIIFSVMLIFNPSIHHLESHLILLGFELALEVIFPELIKIERKLLNKNKHVNIEEVEE